MALLLLLCELMKTKLEDNGHKLYIKTHNLQQVELDKGEASPCGFTYFECFFAFGTLLLEKQQQKLEEFIITLFFDYEFKKYIALTYVKMIKFVFYKVETKGKEKEETITEYKSTRLTGLNVQLFTAEEFSIIAADSVHFEVFLNYFDSITKWFVDNPSNDNYYIWVEYYQFFEFAIQKKTSRDHLLKTNEFISKYLDWLDMLNYSFMIDYENRAPLTPDTVEDKLMLIEVDQKILVLADVIFTEISMMKDDNPIKASLIKHIGSDYIRILKQH